MPQLDWITWAIWLTYAFGQASAALFVWRRGFVRQWPSLACFLVIRSAVDFLLLGITFSSFLGKQQCVVYFYTYWCGAGLASIAEMWMIVQIGSALVAGSRKAVRWVWMTAPVVAVLCVLGAAGLSLWPNYGPNLKVVSTVVGLDRIVSISWLTTFLCVAVFSDILGIRWRRHPFGIAIGLAIQATTAIGVSWFLETLTYANAALLSKIADGTYLLTLATWSITLAKDEPIYELESTVKAALSSVLTFRTALQQRTFAK